MNQSAGLLPAGPAIDVPESEISRLVGYPSQQPLEGRAKELMDLARSWYQQFGAPWIYHRIREIEAIEEDRVLLSGGAVLTSQKLAERLSQTGAHQVLLFAASAGERVSEEIIRLWQRDHPDEGFLLDAYASGIVEQLALKTGILLCEWAEPQGLTALAHYSPGYAGWDVSEQSILFESLIEGTSAPLPGPLEVMPSAMLKPQKSMLGVFGLTRYPERVTQSPELCPCLDCPYPDCAYRRAPRSNDADKDPYCAFEGVEPGKAPAQPKVAPRPDEEPSYAFPKKALERWSRELLELTFDDDQSVQARFRYDGNTCSNSGFPLSYTFNVELSSCDDGYRILSSSCRPRPEDGGTEAMCAYIADPAGLMNQMENYRPLLGSPLSEALDWAPDVMPSGCFCAQAHRDHKWRIVFQTIHYGLRKHECTDS